MTDLITAEEAEKLLDGTLLMELANEHRALLLQAIGTDDADAMAYSKDGKPIRRVSEITSPAKQAAEVIGNLARTVIDLHAQLADAQAAVALVVAELRQFVTDSYQCGCMDAGCAGRHAERNSTLEALSETLDALAHIDGLALVRELRAERDEALVHVRFHVDDAVKAWNQVAALADRLENEMADLNAADRRNKRLAAANVALEAKVAGLRDFVDDFAKAKIDALRYSPPCGSSPEDEPDPVVDAETVWAWQADAKAALATQEAGNG